MPLASSISVISSFCICSAQSFILETHTTDNQLSRMLMRSF